MNFQNLLKSLVTLGPLGYLFAPGTIGSLFGLFLVLIFYKIITNIFCQFLLILAFFFIGFIILSHVIIRFNSKDPSEIILDEVIGCFIVFCGIDLSPKNILLGFFLFRLLDITKILGIVYLELFFDGAFAILIDDAFAGLITNIILRYFFN